VHLKTASIRTALVLLTAGLGVGLVHPNAVWASGTTIDFTPPVVTDTTPLGSSLISSGVGDFTGDGIPDLVAANNGTPATLNLYEGTRTGAFMTPTTTPLTGSDQVRGLAVGDINRDGNPDVVIGTTVPPSEVALALGNGMGGFTVVPGALVSGSPWTLALADLNGDSNLDLIVADVGAKLAVLTGNGNGTFNARVEYAIPDLANQIATGDINGDGDIDVATANGAMASVSILYGNGTGVLAPAVTIPMTNFNADLTFASGIAIGDFDQDGLGELAVTANGNFASPGLYLITPRGTPSAQYYAQDATPGLSATGDVTGDGIPDVVTAWSGSDRLVIWAGDGISGLVTPPYRQVMGLRPDMFREGAYTPFLVDMDTDGVNDVVVAGVDWAMGTVLNRWSPTTNSSTVTQFTFLLPDGRECSSISPMRVEVGTMVMLPAVDALCRTMPGATVHGWTIPVPPGFTGYGSEASPFPPGLPVRVTDSQRFTVVPFEPVLTFHYDANVATADTCTSSGLAHSRGRIADVWVPREDIAAARFTTAAACTPPGYILRGWNTRGDGTGTEYRPGDALPPAWGTASTNVRTFYATWQSR
jgi:FG-GAP-like repeat